MAGLWEERAALENLPTRAAACYRQARQEYSPRQEARPDHLKTACYRQRQEACYPPRQEERHRLNRMVNSGRLEPSHHSTQNRCQPNQANRYFPKECLCHRRTRYRPHCRHHRRRQ